jgi:hypothetical protein
MNDHGDGIVTLEAGDHKAVLTHFSNLFEVPVPFYVVCSAAIAHITGPAMQALGLKANLRK